jgi:hypothetical protein
MEFEAEIVEAPRGGAYVRVPSEVAAALGGRGRMPVRATFDGIDYQGSIVTMGGEKVLGLLKAIRAQLGKEPGEAVLVTVELDERERTVAVPEDLRAALDGAGVLERFESLSFSHRREYVGWIGEAKRAATRDRRIAETVERIQH